MQTIQQIQNLKLREFLETYHHFQDLTEEEQQKYLEKILIMTDEKQNEVYEFLYTENEKEKIRMLKALNEKLTELGKVLKKIKTEEEESIETDQNNTEIDSLMKEMDTL